LITLRHADAACRCLFVFDANTIFATLLPLRARDAPSCRECACAFARVMRADATLRHLIFLSFIFFAAAIYAALMRPCRLLLRLLLTDDAFR